MPRAQAELQRLRCPNCGINLYRGYHRFPVCHECGTNAMSCRGCLSFDAQAGVCTDVVSPIDTVQDADALPDCGRFRPRLAAAEAEARPLGRRFWLYVALGVVVVVFLAALAYRYLLAKPRPAEHNMRALIGLPSEIFPGTSFEVSILVDNTEEELGHAFEVRLGPETLASAELHSASPKPQREITRGNARYLQYGMVPPGEQQRVLLRLTPGETGRARLRVRVVDEKGHWVADERADIRIEP